MKIKIGDKIYTSKEQPIMVILSQEDKDNISEMDRTATKYAEFDSSLSLEYKMKFMETEENE